MDNVILEARGINKRFPGVNALNDVHFSLNRGEVRALMGKNGAGKSTLIKTITGVYPFDSGEVYLDGERIRDVTPYNMHHYGIGAIYQENDLIPYFTIGQSMFLNNEYRRAGIFLNSRRMHREAGELMKRVLDVDIDPYTIIDNLNVSQKQLVQIATQLFYKSKILIFDEPTASLSSTEIEKLFAIIEKLKNDGVSIIYISHRLEEVFHISDTITVMKDGCKVADLVTKDITEAELISAMTGGADADEEFTSRGRDSGRVSLRIRKLKAEGIKSLDLDLHEGEILGVFGAEGAGQENLSNILYGVAKHEAELFELNGKPVTIKKPKDAIKLNIGCVPRDRKREGMISDFSVAENVTIANMGKFSARSWVKKKLEHAEAGKMVEKLAVKTPSTSTIIRTLSGGNQQKVIIARWLTLDLSILILDYPTSGIDVHAKNEVYRILRTLADNGTSMILITPEYDEIKSLCDRVVVIRNGEAVAVLPVKDLSESTLLTHAIGMGGEKESGEQAEAVLAASGPRGGGNHAE
ncbi:MAG: sugar ABC transporter ATP-binding protein [Planctomycetes bacterium]|nr:sugar ABC transporter ATP-binding protein [Planctomycetota bacterium]